MLKISMCLYGDKIRIDILKITINEGWIFRVVWLVDWFDRFDWIDWTTKSCPIWLWLVDRFAALISRLARFIVPPRFWF